MREIIFYHTDSDKCPIEEFLDSLSGKQAQKVLWVLHLIQELDIVPSQYFKKLVNTDKIWEVRVQVGNNTFRLLGFFDSDIAFPSRVRYSRRGTAVLCPYILDEASVPH